MWCLRQGVQSCRWGVRIVFSWHPESRMTWTCHVGWSEVMHLCQLSIVWQDVLHLLTVPSLGPISSHLLKWPSSSRQGGRVILNLPILLVLVRLPCPGCGIVVHGTTPADRGNTSVIGQTQSYCLVSGHSDESWSRGEFEIVDDHRVRKTVSLGGRPSKCDAPHTPHAGPRCGKWQINVFPSFPC